MNKVGADGSSREKTRMTQVNKPRRPSPKRRIVVQLVGGVDRPFLVTVILLLCLGTVMVFSASYPYANANFKGDSYHFAKRQILFALAGLAVMAFVARSKIFDYHFLRKIALPTLAVSIVLLAGVLVFGKNLSGAKRWYAIGPITYSRRKS